MWESFYSEARKSITGPKAPRKFFVFSDPETRNILTYPKILSICLFRSSKKYNGAEGAAKIFGYFSNVAIDKPEVFELTRTFWKSFQSVTRKSSGRAKMFGSCQNQITKILQHCIPIKPLFFGFIAVLRHNSVWKTLSGILSGSTFRNHFFEKIFNPTHPNFHFLLQF